MFRFLKTIFMVNYLMTPKRKPLGFIIWIILSMVFLQSIISFSITINEFVVERYDIYLLDTSFYIDTPLHFLGNFIGFTIMIIFILPILIFSDSVWLFDLRVDINTTIFNVSNNIYETLRLDFLSQVINWTNIYYIFSIIMIVYIVIWVIKKGIKIAFFFIIIAALTYYFLTLNNFI